jgi:TRAP-type mannitol/chloroaromatic compound transport system substrate-binding protein
MPFGMTANEQHAWFEYGGGQELMDKVYAKLGIKSIIGGNTSNQMGGWFKKELTTWLMPACVIIGRYLVKSHAQI